MPATLLCPQNLQVYYQLVELHKEQHQDCKAKRKEQKENKERICTCSYKGFGLESRKNRSGSNKQKEQNF